MEKKVKTSNGHPSPAPQKFKSPKERGLAQLWATREDHAIISAACKDARLTQLQMSSIMASVLVFISRATVAKKLNPAQSKRYAQAFISVILASIQEIIAATDRYYDKIEREDPSPAPARVPLSDPALAGAVIAHDRITSAPEIGTGL